MSAPRRFRVGSEPSRAVGKRIRAYHPNEDETDAIQFIIWPKVFEQYRRIVMRSRLVAMKDKLHNSSGAFHVVAHRLIDGCADFARFSGATANSPRRSLALAGDGHQGQQRAFSGISRRFSFGVALAPARPARILLKRCEAI